MIAALWLAAGFVANARADDDTQAPSRQPSALDRQLLGELDNDLLDGADLSEAAKNTADSGESRDGQPDVADEPAGEDVGAGPTDVMDRTGRRMRAAERSIPEPGQAKRTGALHEQILTDLDGLIKVMEKKCQQCQGGGSGKPSSSPGVSQRGGVKQPGQGAGRPGRQAGEGPARNSSARLGPNKTSKVDLAEMQDLMKGLWGHLPERAREQMLQAPPQQFLPKYELMLEEYFRQLATEPEKR